MITLPSQPHKTRLKAIFQPHATKRNKLHKRFSTSQKTLHTFSCKLPNVPQAHLQTCVTSSEMTYIVSGGALNSTHSLTPARILIDVFPVSGKTAKVETIRN